jgi:hypothetical protein
MTVVFRMGVARATRPRRLRWLVPLLVVVLWNCGGGNSDEAQLPFTVLEETAFSAIATPAALAIRHEPSWAALWSAHTARMEPPRPRPTIDWSRQTVAAIFLGELAACHRPRVDAVQELRDAITVRWTHVTPQPNELCIAALVRPVQMIRFDNPRALPVTFIESR